MARTSPRASYAGTGRAQQVLKKICEIGVGFSFAALSVFRLRRAQNDPFGTGPNALQNVMALGMQGENCWRRCKNGSSANLVQIDALLVTGAHGSQTGLA